MSDSERKPLLGSGTPNNDAIPQPSAPELIGEQPPPYVEEPSAQPQICKLLLLSLRLVLIV